MKPVFSVVVPVYNERECLPMLKPELARVLDQTGEPWEIVLIDDGSSDGSSEIMQQMSMDDPRIRSVFFARNFGHQTAVTAGMDQALGDAVIVIDADLQDPPEVILELIDKWREGYEVVYAVRKERDGETQFKKATASAFYRLIYKITDIKIPMDTGDFRLLDRKVVDVMGNMREGHRFLRGMSAWAGFNQIGVPYHRKARAAGTSKYPLKKMIKLAMNAITGFSSVPLQIAMTLGSIITICAFVIMLVLIIMRAKGADALMGQATTLISTLFIGGIQLICLGIIGEYLGRIYDEVKHRPLYITREVTRSVYDKAEEN